MRKFIYAGCSLLFVVFFIFVFQIKIPAQSFSGSGVNLQIVTDEAEAVLQILGKKEKAQEITGADWQKVFASEGYVRLKKRELAIKRPFEDSDFEKFVLSDELFKRREILTETLSRWKETDIKEITGLALAYLPANAQIRAKVYPVIKPRTNTFVFDLPDNPAIFLYLDPTVSREKFKNTTAHELHHIGLGSNCPNREAAAEIKKYSENMQKVLKWIGAFGEGFAMLAAAGGADIHPHAVSEPDEKAHWDKDMANFNNNLKTVEKFFLDLAEGRLSEETEIHTARSFYGTQGPWYTVGWQMAVVIEKTFGRKRLIDCICDQRKLLPAYNEAVGKFNSKNNKQLTLWSKELIEKLK